METTTNLPNVFTIEFIDGDIVHITFESREGARALAMAHRIQNGLP